MQFCITHTMDPHAVPIAPPLWASAVPIACLQGTPGGLGEFDMSSGCCLATAELRSTPVSLAYSMDGRLLIALLQVHRLWKARFCIVQLFHSRLVWLPEPTALGSSRRCSRLGSRGAELHSCNIAQHAHGQPRISRLDALTRSMPLQDRSLVAYAGQLSQRQALLAGAGRHEKKQQEYHLAVSAVSFQVTWLQTRSIARQRCLSVGVFKSLCQLSSGSGCDFVASTTSGELMLSRACRARGR